MADHNITDGIENMVKGTMDDLTGKLKDAVGGLTGDPSLQIEGKIDQAKGKLLNMLGEAEQKLGRTDLEM